MSDMRLSCRSLSILSRHFRRQRQAKELLQKYSKRQFGVFSSPTYAFVAQKGSESHKLPSVCGIRRVMSPEFVGWT